MNVHMAPISAKRDTLTDYHDKANKVRRTLPIRSRIESNDKNTRKSLGLPTSLAARCWYRATVQVHFVCENRRMQVRLQLGWAVLCFVMCGAGTYFAVELPNLMSHIATHWIAAIVVVQWTDHRWYWCHCHPQQSTYSDSEVDNPFCSWNTVCTLTIWPAIKSDSLSGWISNQTAELRVSGEFVFRRRYKSTHNHSHAQLYANGQLTKRKQRSAAKQHESIQ